MAILYLLRLLEDVSERSLGGLGFAYRHSDLAEHDRLAEFRCHGLDVRDAFVNVRLPVVPSSVFPPHRVERHADDVIFRVTCFHESEEPVEEACIVTIAYMYDDFC